MPSLFTVDTSKPVLVTGASGYVAGVLIQQLLEYGVTVHATVRDATNREKVAYLQTLADQSPGRIQFFSADLTQPGSFGDAMKGCSIVFHTASPFTFNNITDPIQQLMEPAVNGTKNVLEQVAKTPSVDKVIVTSSIAAMVADASETSRDHPLTEDVWNRTASLTYQPYALSKTMAELAAWTMAGSQTQYKLITINPGFVMGPGVKYHADSASYQTFLRLTESTARSAGVPNIGTTVVDVRDVAYAHIAAAYVPTAKGRYLVVGQSCFFSDWGQAVVAGTKNTNGKKVKDDEPTPPSSRPPLPIAHKKSIIPKWLLWCLAPYVGLGRSFVWKNIDYTVHVDTTKSKTELGIAYRPMEETFQDMFQQLVDLGIIQMASSTNKSPTDHSTKKD